MALYAFDGTGNEDEEFDTSVLEFFRAYDDPFANSDPDEPRGSLYQKGIGTLARTILGEGVAEALGLGGHDRVNRALKRVTANLQSGDTVVDIVGFSRGAALAVSFANRVKDTLGAAVDVRFVGLWDVVGQFGVPGEHVNAGHNLRWPRHARNCYHAMALDESRLFFPLTRLAVAKAARDPRLVEAWFRGVHSDIGGGNGNRGLNWIALHWMYENARRHGLPIRADAIAANLLNRDVAQEVSDHRVDLEHRRTIRADDLLHTSVRLEPGRPGRPHFNPAMVLARLGDDGQIVVV